MKSWHHEPHTADIRSVISGDSYAELFESGAAALYDITKPAVINTTAHIKKTVSLKAESAELLLVDFLSELLYLLEAEKSAATAYQWLSCSAQKLEVIITLVPVGHLEGVAIKAITYHDLHITKKDTLLTTSLIFDI